MKNSKKNKNKEDKSTNSPSINNPSGKAPKSAGNNQWTSCGKPEHEVKGE